MIMLPANNILRKTLSMNHTAVAAAVCRRALGSSVSNYSFGSSSSRSLFSEGAIISQGQVVHHHRPLQKLHHNHQRLQMYYPQHTQHLRMMTSNTTDGTTSNNNSSTSTSSTNNNQSQVVKSVCPSTGTPLLTPAGLLFEYESIMSNYSDSSGIEPKNENDDDDGNEENELDNFLLPKDEDNLTKHVKPPASDFFFIPQVKLHDGDGSSRKRVLVLCTGGTLT